MHIEVIYPITPMKKNITNIILLIVPKQAKPRTNIANPQICTIPINQIFILLKHSIFFIKTPYKIVPNPPVIKFSNIIQIPFSLFLVIVVLLGLKKTKLWKIPTYIELK